MQMVRDNGTIKSTSQDFYTPTKCPFRFSPHTAHNSLVLDLKFSLEIESAFSSTGTAKQKRNAILELRQRVRREAGGNSPNWELKREGKREGGERGEKVKVYRKR